jgi:hypothetical protein
MAALAYSAQSANALSAGTPAPKVLTPTAKSAEIIPAPTMSLPLLFTTPRV